MKYVKTIFGVFIQYDENNYALSGRAGGDKYYEYSPWKLHVSLAKRDYLKHNDKIREFLISQFSDQDGYFKEFKMVDFEVVKLHIQKYNELLKLLLTYKQILQGKDAVEFDMRDFFEKINKHFKRMVFHKQTSLPTAEKIDTYIECLKNEKSLCKRWFYGDQFTLYLPINFDYKVFLNICQVINNYLTKVMAIPGHHADIASIVSDYISLRQPYLLKHHNAFVQSRRVDKSKRIDAICFDANEEITRKRAAVKLEQDNSKLYRDIRSDLLILRQGSHDSFHSRIGGLKNQSRKTLHGSSSHTLFTNVKTAVDEKTIYGDYDISKKRFQDEYRNVSYKRFVG